MIDSTLAGILAIIGLALGWKFISKNEQEKALILGIAGSLVSTGITTAFSFVGLELIGTILEAFNFLMLGVVGITGIKVFMDLIGKDILAKIGM